MRRFALFIVCGCQFWASVVFASGGPPRPPATGEPQPPGQHIYESAVRWLVRQQSPDGGWHSETYGLLKSGQAYTPFVLHALITAKQNHAIDVPPEVIARGLGFLRRQIRDDGWLGRNDSFAPEYPTYATAYALRCLAKVDDPQDRERRKRMRQALVGSQFTEANGYGAAHPAHGSWGFGARPEGATGHLDLAHTRDVLQALAGDNGDAANANAARRAEHLLRLLQKHPSETRAQPPSLAYPDHATGPVPYDGGFYFSPVILAANKGRERVETSADGTQVAYYASYATATCDGLLSLLAAGVPRTDERVQDALRWLERHPRLDTPEGIPPDDPERWGEALFYYHLAVRAEAYGRIGFRGDWRHRIAQLLAARQAPDGRFRNTASPLMKEDDPILATTLAVMAIQGTRIAP